MKSRKVPKLTSIVIGVIFACAGIILSYTYRPYIYDNQIFDCHFADVIGNIVAVPAALFFLSGLKTRTIKISQSLPPILLAFILFEILGLLGIHGTFDAFDIIATLISGGMTYLILYHLFNIREL